MKELNDLLNDLIDNIFKCNFKIMKLQKILPVLFEGSKIKRNTEISIAEYKNDLNTLIQTYESVILDLTNSNTVKVSSVVCVTDVLFAATSDFESKNTQEYDKLKVLISQMLY